MKLFNRINPAMLIGVGLWIVCFLVRMDEQKFGPGTCLAFFTAFMFPILWDMDRGRSSTQNAFPAVLSGWHLAGLVIFQGAWAYRFWEQSQHRLGNQQSLFVVLGIFASAAAAISCSVLLRFFRRPTS